MYGQYNYPAFITLALSMLLLLVACPDKGKNTPEPLSQTKDLALQTPTITLKYSGNVGETIKVYTPKIVDTLRRNIIAVLQTSDLFEITTRSSASSDTTIIKFVKAGSGSVSLKWSAPEITREEDANNDGVKDQITYGSKTVDLKLEFVIQLQVPPTKPKLVLPKDRAVNVPLDIRLSWFSSLDDNGDAVTYEVWLGASVANLAKVADNLKVTQFAAPGLVAKRSYFWKVIAKDGTGSNTSAVFSFTTLKAGAPGPPTKPVLLSPANGATNVPLRPTFRWRRSTDPNGDAVTYNIWAGLASSLLQKVNLPLPLRDTFLIVPDDLDYNITYFWGVYAKAGGDSTASDIARFTTQAGPVKLSKPNIPTASEDKITGFKLSWRRMPRATKYDVEVTSSSGGRCGSVVKAFNNLTDTFIVVTGLSYNTRYCVRMRAKTNIPAETSDYSDYGGVSTTTLGGSAFLPVTALTTTSFTLNWKAADSEANRYDVQVDDNKDFSSLTRDLADQTRTSAALTGLTPNTTYYFRIRTRNTLIPGAISSYSSGDSVTTKLPTPTLKAASSITSTLFTVNWNAVTGATKYDLEVDDDNRFTSLDKELRDQTGTSATVTGLRPGIAYYVRLRAENTRTSSAFSNTQTVVTVLSPPILNDPTLVSSSGFTISWNAVTGATKYNLVVDDNNDYSSPTKNLENLTGTSRAVTGLAAGTVYYVHIRAQNALAAATSTYSPTKTVVTKLPTPTLKAASSITNSGFTVNWNAVTGATKYRLQISRNSAFSSLVQDLQNVTGTSRAITGLNVNSGYYVHLRAESTIAAAASPYSAVQSISTSAAANRPPSSLINRYVAPTFRQTNVPLDQKLTWRASTDPDGDPVTYDVYLDKGKSATSGPPTTRVASGISDTTYAPSGGFEGSTDYRWRIFAKDNKGDSTGGAIYDFTTAAPPPFTVTSTAFNNGDAKTSANFNDYFDASFGQCNGRNNVIPIAWSNAPAGTESFVIFMEDTFTRRGAAESAVHWYEYKISKTISSAPAATPLGFVGTAGISYNGGLGYAGPCPPDFNPDVKHTYTITIYALSTAQPTKADGNPAQLTSDFKSLYTGVGAKVSEVLGTTSIHFTVTR